MLVARTVPQQAALAVVRIFARIFARIVACIVAQIVARIVVRIVAGTGSRIVANACALGYARMRFGIYLGFFSRWLQVASGCCRRAEHQCLPAPAEAQGSAGKRREEQGEAGGPREVQGSPFAPTRSRVGAIQPPEHGGWGHWGYSVAGSTRGSASGVAGLRMLRRTAGVCLQETADDGVVFRDHLSLQPEV